MILPRTFFDRPSVEVAPDLLGRMLVHDTPEGAVSVRITEVEAYSGEADPASHAYRGRTRRNEVMYGPPGHAYVYFTYGMHFCVNLVCLGEGVASAVLLRAGEVVDGLAPARERARAGAPIRDLARGPARLTRALGIARDQNGADVCDPSGPLRVLEGTVGSRAAVRTGPRTGVNAAKDVPWRFYLDADPTVSPYRAHQARARR